MRPRARPWSRRRGVPRRCRTRVTRRCSNARSASSSPMTAERAAAAASALVLLALSAPLLARQPAAAPIEAYVEALHAAIQRSWLAPEARTADLDCAVDI